MGSAGREGKVNRAKWWLGMAILLAGVFWQVSASAFVLNVVDNNGNLIAGGFRWLLEEDNTVLTVPGAAVNNSIGLSIHNSHAPVITKGNSGGLPSTNVQATPSGRYFVSVLPDSGYSNGGASVAVNQGTVTVTVHPLPLPTAQISLIAYVDQRPINNLKDEGEPGLGGCTVVVSDAAGPLSQDAFGNPLGTQYELNPATGDPVFDASGNPIVTRLGTGVITTLTQNDFDAGLTDPTRNPYKLNVGEALVKYIAPGKYAVTVVPPRLDDAGRALTFSQTTTIEGTPVIDAWVKAREAVVFVEGFGTSFKHVAFGFVKTSPDVAQGGGLTPGQLFRGQLLTRTPWNVTPPTGTGTITGRLVYNHFSRPPTTQGFFSGEPVPECWIGLNDPLAQREITGPGGTEVFTNVGLYHAKCNADSTFTITNVPPGTYQLVAWDTPLDALFFSRTVDVPAPPASPNVNLGDVLIFRWFGTLKGSVFYDHNLNGFRNCVTPACNDPLQDDFGISNQNINIRFRDGSIYQTTPTDPFGDYEFPEVFPFFKWLVAEVDFLRYKATGMTAVVDYGGGPIPPHAQAPPFPQGPTARQFISTTPSFNTLYPQPQFVIPNAVSPATPGGTPVNNLNTGNNLSRTETGPVLTQAMHLFLNQTNVIDWGKASYGPTENGGISGIVYYATTRAENDPRFGAAETWEPGIPRVTVNLYQDFNNDGIPDGPAIATTTTDSWDDDKPTGCVQSLPVVHGQAVNECADAFHTWNQLRPGVFDGGYAFGPAAGDPPLPPGIYIVEVIPPPGYEIVKEEDKNVDYGDSYQPSPLVLPPVCVGALHTVPPYLSLFPDQQIPTPNWFAGWQTPLCDRKQIAVTYGGNFAVDFFLFTEVPKAARVVGFTNNDLAAEFNVFSPNFGEKLAPSFLPVSFKDWAGKEIVRVYTDEFGSYNALLPSTYTVNAPSPSGVSPNMVTAVINDPVRADGTPDPWYNPTYSITPWTLEYYPGKTTYLDTPIVPMTAMATAGVGVDTEPATLSPVIASVTTPNFPAPAGGPVICTNATLPANITITSAGLVSVLNPNYVPGVSGTLFIQRNYGFGGTTGTVALNGVSLNIVNWSDTSITATVPNNPNVARTGQLMVTRGDNGKTSEIGLTLNIVDCSVTQVVTVAPNPGAGINFTSIQAAIDAPTTRSGDIVLVTPGNYAENVIMNKPVRLQGAGAGSTGINANPIPIDRIQAWHNRMNALGAREFAAFLLKDPFSANEASAVAVLGELSYPGGNLQFPDPNNPRVLNPGYPFFTPGQARIDGFTLQGSKAGGGVFAIVGAKYLTVSNNNINGNQGTFAGGVAVGTSDTGFDAQNVSITIRNNKIHRNGGTQGAGGVAMNEGAHNYLVAENWIVGNFCRFKGAGIGHEGVSNNGTIARNNILYNENNFGALLNQAGDGGGIFVGATIGLVNSTGTGTVTIDGNLIQGNLSGAGYGGGIMAQAVNGNDVLTNPTNPAVWYRLNIFNNVIVNNVAARAGGGIYLQDVVFGTLTNNTVANNDSTATSSLSFAPGAANSTPEPAGIVTGANSATLQALLNVATGAPYPVYSNPAVLNNIVRNNRSFFNNAVAGVASLAPSPIPTWDLGVVNTPLPQFLTNVQNNALTALTYETGSDYTPGANVTADPTFTTAYLNGCGSPAQNFPCSATVIDEGGNNIAVRFTPTAYDPNSGNYHIGNAGLAGAAVNVATFPPLARDFDRQARDIAAPDIGADEIAGAAVNYSLYASGGTGGAISPSGVVIVSPGASQTFNITPTTPGTPYSVFVDGVSQGTVASYTFANVTADHTISVSFGNTITATAGANGTISPSGAITVAPGATQIFTITPSPGYRIFDVQVDGVSQGPIRTYTFTNVLASHTISAAFELSPTFVVTASAGTGGTITPSGALTVITGTTQTFAIAPLPGYRIVDVLVDGASQGSVSTYTFTNILADHTIAATFASVSYKIGVFRNGQWFLDLNGNGAWDGCTVDACFASFGQAGDIPVAGDWTGTNTAKVGVFRSGQWFLDLNGNGAWDGCSVDGCIASFGQAGDIPVAGDWTGTGTAKVGVFRNGQWFLDLNGNGAWDGCTVDGCYASFGAAGDKPVTGDWTGTGTAKAGVFRSGQWFLDLNGNGIWDGCTIDGCFASFGLPTDVPVTGSWTGTAGTNIGVFRNGAWFLDLNGNGAWDDCTIDGCVNSFGMAGDKPVFGIW
jgi:parallel beta-helix repeat protein